LIVDVIQLLKLAFNCHKMAAVPEHDAREKELREKHAELLSIKPKGRNRFGRTRLFVGAAGNEMDFEETDT